MNEHELFQKSFSTLHASENTLQKVMDKAHSGKSTKGISKRIAVVAATVVMLLSMTLGVYAVKQLYEPVAGLSPAENPGWAIEAAFGDKISTQKPDLNIKDSQGNRLEESDMERVPVDLTEAKGLVGDYVYDVDGIITHGENIVIFKSYLIDETGCGVIIWTLENPNGVIYCDSGYGGIYFPHENPLCEPELDHYGADGRKKSGVYVFNTLLSKNEDGTKLEIVTYFGTSAEYQIGDSFAWNVTVYEGWKTKTIKIPPAKAHLPAKTMTAAEGMRLRITNNSITFDNDNQDRVAQKIIIHFTDGTQYCLYDYENRIRNTPGSFTRITKDYQQEGSSLAFNRLIDINAVASIEVTANLYGSELVDGQYVRVTQQENYVFYP